MMNIPHFIKFNSMDFDTKIVCKYIEDDNSIIFLSIEGDMETFYTRFFMSDMFMLLDREKHLKTVYLDFDKVKYVSSSFIASLLQIINKAKLADVDIFFLNLNTSMHNVVDSMGLAHFVKEIDTKKHKTFKIVCKKCKKNLVVSQVGDFECPYCRTLLHISKRGVVK